MGQVSIYLDDENEKRLKAAGVPVSRWVANLVEKKAGIVWPEAVRGLAGVWRDFPDLESIRKTARATRSDARPGYQHPDLFFPRPGKGGGTAVGDSAR